jgi:MarR family transcriptional regulator for hemolysin
MNHQSSQPPWARVEGTIMAAARTMRRAYDRAFADIGINLAEATILAHLIDGQLTQSELARRVGTSRARIGGSIDSLVPKGAVERVPDAADRRVWLVTITDEGRLMWKRSVAADRALRKRIRLGTTEKQRDQLDEVLTLIHKNLENILDT